MTSVAIMQPTFLPWLGYLDLMKAVDSFVFLDTVQLDHRSWQHRNRIRTAAGLTWLTVPVRRDDHRQALSDIRIGHSDDHPQRHLARFDEAYRTAPFRETARAILEPLEASREDDLLVELDLALIDRLRTALGVDTPVQRASRLASNGARGELLASLCSSVGATTYVTPPGSVDYLLDDQEHFEIAGIEVVVHEYEHPTYPQCHAPFVSHAASIDAIANLGGAAGALLTGPASQWTPLADFQQGADR